MREQFPVQFCSDESCLSFAFLLFFFQAKAGKGSGVPSGGLEKVKRDRP